jgi:hypothetical protein
MIMELSIYQLFHGFVEKLWASTINFSRIALIYHSIELVAIAIAFVLIIIIIKLLRGEASRSS